jgi:MFS family permease
VKNSRPLTALMGAEFLSQLGNQIAAIAIPLLVLEFTGSPLLTGLAGAANILPVFLAALLGGRAIDRLGAWWVALVADSLSLFSVLLLPILFLTSENPHPLWIFLLVFAGALFDPTCATAKQTMVPRLARFARRPLESVNSRRGGLENSADFFGPLVGSAIIGVAGVVAVFFINAASFALSALLVGVLIPQPRRARRKLVSSRTAAGGLKFIFADRSLRGLAIAGMAANAVILPFLGLALPMLVTRELQSPALLGVAVSVFGLAATAGAFLFSRLAKFMSRSAIFYGGLILTALSFSACGLVSSAVLLLIFSSSAGILLGAGNPLEQTVLQERVPPAISGQIYASLTAARYAAGPLGLLLAGFVAEQLNIKIVLLGSGALLFFTAILGWVLWPIDQLRVRDS